MSFAQRTALHVKERIGQALGTGSPLTTREDRRALWLVAAALTLAIVAMMLALDAFASRAQAAIPESRAAGLTCATSLARCYVAAGAKARPARRVTKAKVKHRRLARGITHKRKTAKAAGSGVASLPATVVSSLSLVTVPTAAGIAITVAAERAAAFQGFIADLVAGGYLPKQIHCFARRGHVRHSNHYTGNACDFDQDRQNKTAAPMYRVADLAKKWGLRDGCSFRDCGHVDFPPRYAARERAGNLYATAAARKDVRAVAAAAASNEP